MGELTATLKAHVPSAAFMPAANSYYLKDDPFYAGLASALAQRRFPGTPLSPAC